MSHSRILLALCAAALGLDAAVAHASVSQSGEGGFTGDCSDGVDNNRNGAIDCDDTGCLRDPACDESFHCTDGIDNDSDGLTDCADPRCASMPVCQENGGPTNCLDGIDNDLDGATDCEQDVCHHSYEGCWAQMCWDPQTIDGVFYAVIELAGGALKSVRCEVLMGVASCLTDGVGADNTPLLALGPPVCGGAQ